MDMFSSSHLPPVGWWIDLDHDNDAAGFTYMWHGIPAWNAVNREGKALRKKQVEREKA